MPYINYAHICEYARVEQSGSVSIIGIFDTIHVLEIPTSFPFLHVVTSLSGQRSEKFQFFTRLSAPDGKILQAAPPVEIVFHQDDASVKQINGYIGIALPAFGIYSIEFLINNTVVHTIPFRVVQKPGKS